MRPLGALVPQISLCRRDAQPFTRRAHRRSAMPWLAHLFLADSHRMVRSSRFSNLRRDEYGDIGDSGRFSRRFFGRRADAS